MNPTFTTVLLFVILTASSLVTSAKDRWVRDQGTSVEVVVTETPSAPPPVIVIATNATTTIPVVVSTNAVNAAAQPTVVVHQQKATKVAKVREPRQKKSFLAGFFGQAPPTMIDAVSGDKLPANPVRRRSLDFTMMNGAYNYHHSQGTDTYAERSWGDYGPREVVHQSTYVNTSESFDPETRRWIAPTYYQQYQGPQGTVTWP